MFVAAKRIYGASVEGTDGNVGTVKDLLIDRRTWNVRYLELDIGRWLPGRRLILSPVVVEAADYAGQRLSVPLSRKQVEESPPVEADLPVSRQSQMQLAEYFVWEAYWGADWTKVEANSAEADPDLHSARAVSGYHVRGMDGEMGHVEDFIVDDEAQPGPGRWEVRYLVVNTRNWLPGRHVVLPPLWAESIDWEERRVDIGLPCEMIENSPEYDPFQPINRRYEEVFYDYYGRPRYWTGAEHAV